MDVLTLYTAAEVADILRMNPQVIQRKLQAGEIPGYRIGREWRVEKQALLDWLEQHSNQRLRSPADKVMATFFDDQGRLRSLPTHRVKRLIVLRRLVDELDHNRSYPERELNEVLRRFHHDVASLRREMVAEKLVVRTKDGVYKRTAPRERVLSR